MLLVMMSLAFELRAVNILVNPGFESGSAGWTVYTPQGAGGNVFEPQNPTHGGINVYKNWGCWCADTNVQSVVQEKASAAGSTYTAGGFVRSGNGGTPSDYMLGDNHAWLQVAFLDVGGSTLALYQSEHLTSATEPAIWISCDITNHVDPVTGAVLDTVSSLVAPAGTKTVRFSAILQQRNGGGGAVHFDDLSLDQTGGSGPPNIANLAPNGTALFNLAANGITFTASALGTTISPSGIKLILNGLDVSSGLAISPGGSVVSQSVSYMGLAPNRMYSATINVTDDAGVLSSVAMSFDTFATNNFVWEAEDYDYDGGKYINNPTPTAIPDANSYFERAGTAEIDYHESGASGGNGTQTYRDLGVGPGLEWAQDFQRQKYTDAIALDSNVHDFDVGWVSGLDGDWMNFTRDVAAGSYNLYGRLAGGGGVNKCRIARVTSGAGTPTQTTEVLGVMTIDGTGYQSWKWSPLADADGNLVKLTFTTATKVTFRASADNLNMNFFMLAPARDDLPLISNLYPTGQHPFEPTNALAFNVSSAVATIPTSGIQVILNGQDVSPLLTITGNATNRSVALAMLALNSSHAVTINVTDSAGTFLSRKVNFDTFSESNLMIEAEDYNFGSGQYINNPVLSTTTGANNYYGQSVLAVPGVDISTILPASGFHQDYQRADDVGTEPASDYLRKTYVDAQATDAGVRDYNVGWDNAGTWFNYTRDIPAGDYWVYARLAGSGALNATMDLVNGATSTNQTTSALGTFSSTRQADAWQTWGWVPLLTASGSPAVLSGGVKTVRFTTGGNVNHNYFMAVPAKIPVKLSVTPNGAISIPTQAGASYTLQYRTSLASGAWTYLTMVLGDGTTKTVTDPTAGQSQRYYRAIIQ